MLPRLILWSVILGLALAGGWMAYRDGRVESWKQWVLKWSSGEDPAYSQMRFQVDLVDRINYARIASRHPVLRVDAELEQWLSAEFPEMALDDAGRITQRVQEVVPRYFRVSVCIVSGPTLHALLDEFHDFSQSTEPTMTHLACAVRQTTGGLAYRALLIVGQRLEDFSPEIIAASQDETFFSTCPHCQHPHVVRISRQQHSLGLECPECRRTYAVVAADALGHYRYVNEFLTGYAPPAVFAKDHSRIHELFTIWSAVHANCIYTKDPAGQKTTNATDAWQTSLDTQKAGQGDCEDSAIFLCDWLMSRGFQARVVLGRYGDMGGHAWVVVKLDDKEYLLESTEGRPDISNPPLVSRVGSRYVPEIMFDRYAIYVRSTPGQSWKGDYWSTKYWTRVEPRSLSARVQSNPRKKDGVYSAEVSPQRMARTSQPNPAIAPFMELEGIPRDASVWQMPLGGEQEISHAGHGQ
ncbi:Transglutaminase-like superfamily protein [Prosthecobacter debontii]|uniref:Transglutaminase-like superfamily protein n=1 Tax=Prosthecobacter debontii TaxID=48467 RepID=A0A1T4XTE7_9BACT|nr:transglutaminase-like domain-containing protein [Prosthecobacter debontii]SKA92438.1 Transglutaminase-like superfamily protein [Prosthecobacter debontii]